MPQTEDARRSSILRSWQAVERFEVTEIPRRDGARHVIDVKAEDRLPWDPLHPLARERRRPTEEWRHVFYVGVFSLRQAFGILDEVFPPDREAPGTVRGRDAAILSFAVTADGRPIFGSETLSSCAWAISRSLVPGPDAAGWLEGFDEVESAFGEAFRQVAAPEPGDERVAELFKKEELEVGRPLDVATLRRCRNEAFAALTVSPRIGLGVDRVSSTRVTTSARHGADELTMLNSFIADDLGAVADAVALGDCGAALAQYLSEDDDLLQRERVDVDRDAATVGAAASPSRVPAGRWPSSDAHDLALGQQVAVNSIIGELSEGAGVVGVNGPPGTGKTTLLRDLVAGLVVRRAERMAELPDPTAAFVEQYRWKPERGRPVEVFQLDDRFVGFELVLACATNTAAENVTAEIPSIAAIDEGWHGEADYYAALATEVLRASTEPRETASAGAQGGASVQAWGLLAARLGNMGNRRRFAKAFWWAGYEATDRNPTAGSPGGESGPLASEPSDGLFMLLQRAMRSSNRRGWAEAVDAFNAASTAERHLREEREASYQGLCALPAYERALAASDRAVHDAEVDIAEGQAELQGARTTLRRAARDLERAVERRATHRENRPSCCEIVMSLGGAFRDWQRTGREYAEAIRGAEAAFDAAQAALDDHEGALAELRKTHQNASDRREQAASAVAAVKGNLEALKGRGIVVPDADWWSDREQRERRSPWTDPVWNAARTRVFLAALELHRAFVLGAPKQMLGGLRTAMDLLQGRARNLEPATVRAAWQCLFLVVPVISTTFASLPRLFRELDREALGWLLVDEAGQATPQQAVGALWRTRRAVVVGDPLQLEPILTVPVGVQHALRQHHDLHDRWVAQTSSAQRLADRVTRLGTERGDLDDPLWVGFPLNVHRRCDEPMFGIVNAVAYRGQMVNATPVREAIEFPESCWLDVPASPATADGHWIGAEGARLRELLRYLVVQRQSLGEVFAISPFKDVAQQLRRIAREGPHQGLRSGTIHTTQGKEAEIVVLVLGGDPTRSGAKDWAAERPNLVNVAVSRAKRRLYVIGDYAAWADLPHFEVLAADLRRVPPR